MNPLASVVPLVVPLAHMGHAVAVLPFFAPPLVLTFGLVVLTIRDRLRHRNTTEDSR